MAKIGIIVDGQGDHLSIKQRYAGSNFKVLKTDGPRGHSALASDIVLKSRKQVSMLKALKCDRVVLVIDFEARVISYEDFILSLLNEINRIDLQIDTRIVVPNRMIENWYLADVEILSKKKKFIKDNLKQKNYEGSHGKDELKKLFKHNYTYSETDHGPILFTLLRETIAKKNSQSFACFLKEIS